MSRLQLLFPLLFWAIWTGTYAPPVVDPHAGAGIYFLSLAAVVGAMRWLARRTMAASSLFNPRAVQRYHMTAFAARLVVLMLHMVALFLLGFGDFVVTYVPVWGGRYQSLAVIVSILPVLIAWVGLMWAQFPLDRAVREQNVLLSVNAGEPFFPVPSPWEHLWSAIRLQILFMLLPVLLAIVLRDLVTFGLTKVPWGNGIAHELIATFLPVAVIFVLAPELLRRVLPTRPLPDSPLRQRLEALCERLDLRYRDILVWHTHHSLANAAVMGLIPQVRYVLLSDLLLVTMDERQIEAVFAHEAGHIVHRHMTWYVVFVVILVLWLSGLHELAAGLLQDLQLAWVPLDVVMGVAGVALFFVLFGSLSRSFERQADVFAARNLTADRDPSHVDSVGVAIFSSALTQVARVNRMPVDPESHIIGRGPITRAYVRLMQYTGSWLHGSIRYRLDYLSSLPLNPDRTVQFDRRMVTVRILLLVGLCSTAGWTITTLAR